MVLVVAYLLTGISALSGLLPCALGLMLGKMLIFSSRSGALELAAGVFVAIISLLYVAHPLFAISLIKADKLVLSYLYNIVLIGISFVSCYLLGTAISAAAQP